MDEAEQIVAAVREAVGDEIELMIEVHGRLSVRLRDRDGPAAGSVSPGLVRGAGHARTAWTCWRR